MSYKFNLDHTLAIPDIHDMITIDIKPDTSCMVSGNDVAINGYLSFRGSYLTPELGEEPFSGYIPVDISLPYLGGTPDVRPEITAFDYRVNHNESLTISLEVDLKGYDMGIPRKDAKPKTPMHTMDAHVEPIKHPQTYAEAVVEPFDYDQQIGHHHNVEAYSPFINTYTPPTAPTHIQEPVAQAPVATAPQEPVMHTQTPSPDAFVANTQPIVVTTPSPASACDTHYGQTPYSQLIEIQKEEVAYPSFSAAHVISPKPCNQHPSCNQPVACDTVVEVPHEEVVAIRSSLPESTSALIDSLFASRRNYSNNSCEGVRTDEIECKSKERKYRNSSDSVASQFADGKTTLKMVYVEDESQTLSGVLERYTASLDDVWNLQSLNDGVSVGDCVMLRYEKSS